MVDYLAPHDAYDLVVVLMRKNQVSDILPILAANQHTPNVLFMGNNAAGPDEMVEALGRERVLLGFARVGGYRKGHVIITKVNASGPTTIGELDGQSTSRLEQISEAFTAADFSVLISPNIEAWLKTHFVEVGPVAHAIYLAGGDNYRLARTRDGLVLTVRAIREGYEVLRALGVPITPANHKIFSWIPEPILVALMGRLFNARTAEIEMAGHANAARDEFKHLADEFNALARTTSVPTPALDRLYTYIDPALPPLPEGSAQISPSWRSA